MEDSNKKGDSKQIQKPLEYGRKGRELKISFRDYATKETSKRGSQEIKETWKNILLKTYSLYEYTIRVNKSSPYDKGFLRSQKF